LASKPFIINRRYFLQFGSGEYCYIVVAECQKIPDSTVNGTPQFKRVAYRKFTRLSPAQAQKLATAKNLKIKPQDSYSLAEIYNGCQQFGGNMSRREIGFTI
jgi:hypothetical protein